MQPAFREKHDVFGSLESDVDSIDYSDLLTHVSLLDVSPECIWLWQHDMDGGYFDINFEDSFERELLAFNEDSVYLYLVYYTSRRTYRL